MKGVKSVVFDSDGVVIKHCKVFSLRFADRYNVPLVPYKGGLAVSVVADKLSDCLIGKADLRKELPRYFEGWNWKGTVDDILKFWFDGEAEINQKVLDIVKIIKAKGIPVYLATNNEKYRVEYLAKVVGLEKHFDRIFSSAEFGCKKPEKEFYNLILKNMKITNPSTVQFWDDDPENVEGAKAVGIDAYLYTTFSKFKNEINSLF